MKVLDLEFLELDAVQSRLQLQTLFYARESWQGEAEGNPKIHRELSVYCTHPLTTFSGLSIYVSSTFVET